MTECHTQAIKEIDDKFGHRDYLAVVDIANYLEITPRTVTNLIRRGDLTAFRVGREYRIPRSGFKNYLASASAHVD